MFAFGNSLSICSFSWLIMFVLYCITSWIMQEKRSDIQVTVAHHPWGSYHGKIHLPLQRCWKKINLWSENMITFLYDGYHKALQIQNQYEWLWCIEAQLVMRVAVITWPSGWWRWWGCLGMVCFGMSWGTCWHFLTLGEKAEEEGVGLNGWWASHKWGQAWRWKASIVLPKAFEVFVCFFILFVFYYIV